MNTWLKPIQQQLSVQVQQQRLPHALLVDGGKHLDGQELVNWLSNVLLCTNSSFMTDSQILQPCGHCKSCKLTGNGNHPDIINLQLEGEHHGVEAVRKLSHFFEKTAQFGAGQIATIEKAEKMTVAAANALLKTLEEPTDNSFIMLTTNTKDRLLPTIISRCHIIPIRTLTKETLSTLSNQSLVNVFSHSSHIAFLSSEQTAEDFAQFYRVFVEFLNQKAQRITVLEVMSVDNFDIRWCEQVLVDLMRSKQQWLKGQARIEGAHLEEMDGVDSSVIWSLYQLLLDKVHIINDQPQANRQMMLEALLVEIEQALGFIKE